MLNQAKPSWFWYVSGGVFSQNHKSRWPSDIESSQTCAFKIHRNLWTILGVPLVNLLRMKSQGFVLSRSISYTFPFQRPCTSLEKTSSPSETKQLPLKCKKDSDISSENNFLNFDPTRGVYTYIYMHMYIYIVSPCHFSRKVTTNP